MADAIAAQSPDDAGDRFSGPRARRVASFFKRIDEARARASGSLRLEGDAVPRCVVGRAVIEGDGTRVDWSRFTGLVSEIEDEIEELAGLRRAEVASATQAGPSDDEGPRTPPTGLADADWRSLVEAAIEGGGALERRAAEAGRRPETFALAVRYALRALFRPSADGGGETLDAASSKDGRCPVCGAEPVMAEFDKEDGHRRLACGLCGTEWRFARLRCPFCGIEDQKRLGFLEVEGLDGLRADVCEACGRYLKTLDRRSAVAAPPGTAGLEVAELLTPELDEAALSRGYGIRSLCPGVSMSEKRA